jgi:hypothetical protein
VQCTAVDVNLDFGQNSGQLGQIETNLDEYRPLDEPVQNLEKEVVVNSGSEHDKHLVDYRRTTMCAITMEMLERTPRNQSILTTQ